LDGHNDSVIGILSDTHGQVRRTRRARELFVARGIRQLFHCGDIGGDAVIDALADLDVTYVPGNMDPDRGRLLRYIGALGQAGNDPAVRCELAGRRIGMTHGDKAAVLARLIDSQQLDYVFHGHTHVARDERIGRTRIINPGALHGVRSHTVAVLALDRDELEFVEIASD